MTEDTLIQEELTPKQKEKVSRWSSPRGEIKRLHDKVFGDKDKIVIPVPPKTEANKITSDNIESVYSVGHGHTTAVNGVLHRAGYRIHDYEAGLAYHKDTPNRKMSIGKILSRIPEGDSLSGIVSQKTGKPMSIKQAYDADPIRQKTSTHIVISRNKYDVAGMTSEGHPWPSSCMNFVDGCNRRYLPHEVENGTIVAYATNEKNPEELKDPAGRMLIKHHTGISTGEHTMIAESSHYGSMPPRVKNAIKDWVTTNYPKKNDLYSKNPMVYDDDGKSINSEHLKRFEFPPEHVSNAIDKITHHAKMNIEKMADGQFDVQDAGKLGMDDEFYPNENITYHANTLVGNLSRKMDEPTKAHFVLHNSVKALDKYDGDYQDHYSDLDLDYARRGWGDGSHDEEDALYKGFANNGMFSSASHNDAATHIDDKTLHSHIKEVQSSIESKHLDAAEYGWGKHAFDLYQGLTNEAFRRNIDHPEAHQHVVDSIIEHHLDNPEIHGAIQDANDLYDYTARRIPHADGPHRGNIHIGHMMTQTKSIPLFDKYIHHLDENSEYSDEFESSHDSISPEVPMKHFGKHTNYGFAKKMFEHPLVNTDMLDDFTKGMNENKHGEILQHDLTSGFHFPDESETHIDGTHAAFKSIAQHSEFPSVLNKLATRSDISEEVKATARARLNRLGK